MAEDFEHFRYDGLQRSNNLDLADEPKTSQRFSKDSLEDNTGALHKCFSFSYLHS